MSAEVMVYYKRHVTVSHGNFEQLHCDSDSGFMLATNGCHILVISVLVKHILSPCLLVCLFHSRPLTLLCFSPKVPSAVGLHHLCSGQ